MTTLARKRTGRAVAAALGAFFVAAALTKFRDPSDLLQYLAAWPAPRVVASLLMATELCIGAGLLLGLLKGRALLVVPSFILALTIVHTAVYLTLGARPCSCGIGAVRTVQGFVAKNAVLLVLSMAPPYLLK